MYRHGIVQVVGSFMTGSIANSVGVGWAISGAAAVMLSCTLHAF